MEPRQDRQTRVERNQVRGARGIKKTHRIRNAILLILGLLLLIGGGVSAYYYNSIRSTANKTYNDSGVKKQRNVSQILKDGKPFSILLLGTDTGELGRDYKGRTDTMMLATVNPKTDKVTIMSLPRDNLTAIPGYTSTFPQKLNSAYELGSSATAIKTVQQWLNVPIDFYALVNMQALEQVVDQVGGVQVESPLTFNYNPDTAHSDGDNYYVFTKGSTEWTHTVNGKQTQSSDTMDGEAALAFSRMRYADPQGDYGRQQRQRLVVEGIVKAGKSNPTKLVNQKFLDLISKSAQTDLTFGDMLTIVSNYMSASKNIVSDHAQGGEMMIDGVSYEHVSATEMQRVTNKLRSSLGLSKAKTGNLFGGEISSSVLSEYGIVSGGTDDAEDTTSSTSTYSTSTYSTSSNAYSNY